jgi:hypothetical protein
MGAIVLLYSTITLLLGTPTIQQPSLPSQLSELSNVNPTHSVQIKEDAMTHT